MKCFGLLSMVLIALVAAPSRANAEELPDDAKKTIAALEQDVAAIHVRTEEDLKLRQKQAEAEIQVRLAKCVAALTQLQDTYTKSGKLDEALAIRERVRALSLGAYALTPLPVDLMSYRGQSGKVLYIEIVGASGDAIYGTDIYTDDSPLATAAVHAGVLKNAEKGIIKVTILPSQASFAGTDQNGISSHPWGPYEGDYKVEAATKLIASPATTPTEPKKP